MTVTVKYYKLPNGSQRDIEVKNIEQEDARYLNDTGVKVSMEVSADGHTVILYADHGATFSDGEPNEILVLGSMNKYTCEQLFAQLVKELKNERSKKSNPSS